MTISTELRKAGPFTGNGVTTAFPFSFKVFAASDVAVTRADPLGAETALVLNSDFTVAPNPDQGAAPGGTVTLAAPLATGHRLAVTSVVPNLQPTDITNNGGFYPRVIEDALDRHVAQIQQINEKVDRALKVAITSTLGDQALPSPVAGMLIGWNESNDGLKNYAPIGGTLLGQQLAAAHGSSLVGFQQSGTGAVVRTAQDKMREYVSVKDFGAVGDGVTDDGPALALALTASDTVVFPTSAAGYAIKSTVTVTLTRDTVIDCNGQLLTFENSRVNLRGATVATGRTLAANAARYAKAVTLNSGADIQPGDLLFIGTDQLPSSEWPDKKNDCVRIRSVSGAVLTLDEGLNFSYTTGDAGLSIVVYRPVKLKIVNAKVRTIAADADTTTYVNFYLLGLRDVELVSPEFTGQYPFSRANNIYRNGAWLDRCVGATITNMVCEAMSYPVGAYGGSRNILEVGTTARYMHHSHTDVGGWGSDYRLIGLHSSDSFQALNTHVCFRAYADNFTALNDFGLSNWRCCGGGISNGYISSSVDDTAEFPQFQNTTPNPGFEYINADADFSASRTVFDCPNRVTKPAIAVRYGRSAVYSEVTALAWAGLSGGELGLFVCGAGNKFGPSGLAVLSADQIFAVATRTDVAPHGVPTVASTAALTLPLNVVGAQVTGNTTITSIATSGFHGRVVTLLFTGAIQVTDGGNLILASTFAAANSFATLTLVCYDSNWFEVSRSLN